MHRKLSVFLKWFKKKNTHCIGNPNTPYNVSDFNSAAKKVEEAKGSELSLLRIRMLRINKSSENDQGCISNQGRKRLGSGLCVIHYY